MNINNPGEVAKELYDLYARTGTERTLEMALEFYFAEHRCLPVAWLADAKPQNGNVTYEIRDLFGRVSQHPGKIKAIIHIRKTHGWGLALAKRWCDEYGVNLRPLSNPYEDGHYTEARDGLTGESYRGWVDRPEDDQPF